MREVQRVCKHALCSKYAQIERFSEQNPPVQIWKIAGIKHPRLPPSSSAEQRLRESPPSES